MTGLALTILVEKSTAEAIRVARAQLEDVADLHAALQPQWMTALRAGKSLFRRGDVGNDVRGVVAAVVGVEQVIAGLVGAGHQVGLEDGILSSNTICRGDPGPRVWVAGLTGQIGDANPGTAPTALISSPRWQGAGHVHARRWRAWFRLAPCRRG